MRIPGIKTLKRLSRWANARLTGGGLILGYHRVIPGVGDEYQIGVTPEHFAEHLEILRKFANPIQLSDLVSCIKQGSLPPRAVAVTFDDGYADNFHTAFPLLQHYQVPSTMFVCTDFIGRSFWWDQLAWFINSPASLPNALHLELQGASFEWNSAGSSRNKLITSLHLQLFSLDAQERNGVITQVQQWSSAPPFDTASHRAMTSEELRQLVKSGIVDIGSHTRTHPVLNGLSIEKQTDEIRTSRQHLESVLERPVPGFSYPNGAFDEQTRHLVRDSGYIYACMSASGLANKTDAIFQLPRLWPKDWNGKQFLNFLRLWLPV